MDVYANLTQFAAFGLPDAALDGFSGDTLDHLAAASSEVDTYLRGSHKLPLVVPYPIEVVKATCVLAAYSVLSVRGFDPENGADNNVRIRYTDTVKWLTRVSEGKIQLARAADSTSSKHEGGPKVRSRTRDTSWRFR